MGPAIGIIVCAALWLLYLCVAGAVVVTGSGEEAPNDPAERIGFFVGMYGALIALFGMYIAMVYGAIQMLRVKSREWSMAACILALLPCSLCWPIGIGFGIWGLVVLSNDQVKHVMASRN